MREPVPSPIDRCPSFVWWFASQSNVGAACIIYNIHVNLFKITIFFSNYAIESYLRKNLYLQSSTILRHLSHSSIIILIELKSHHCLFDGVLESQISMRLHYFSCSSTISFIDLWHHHRLHRWNQSYFNPLKFLKNLLQWKNLSPP